MSMCTPWNTCLQQGAVATGCVCCGGCRRASTAGGIANWRTGTFAFKGDASLCGTAQPSAPSSLVTGALQAQNALGAEDVGALLLLSCVQCTSWVVGHSTCYHSTGTVCARQHSPTLHMCHEGCPRPQPHVPHPQQRAQPGLHFLEVQLALRLNAHGGHAGGVGVLRTLLQVRGRLWAQHRL